MTRRTLGILGPLDEQLYNHNLDLDHCLRATRHGLRNYVCADSRAYHWRNRSGAIRYARVHAAEAAFWGKWAGEYDVDLGRFFDEAIDHVLTVAPQLHESPLTILDLSRGADQAIALDRLGARWPGVGTTIRAFRQMNNPSDRLSLPLLLPHWMAQDPTAFVYLVDSHQELEQNAMWFAYRRNVVPEELIVDLSASMCTSSQFSDWQTATAASRQYSA